MKFKNMYDYFNKLNFKDVQLTEVQNKIDKCKINKNILVLSSCGSGKTEVAHYKLLRWNKKSIFVQPQKTLATSIYDRLNKYHNELDLDRWTIQHSSIQEDRFLKNKYCVTTIDQVLSGWLGIGKQSFMRGKNAILSNFVFDEVQLFQLDKTLLTTINMLDMIHKQGNNFIIMTATMPSYMIEFLTNRYDMEVIITESDSIENRNVYVNYSEKINFKKINSTQEKQIIICNTQKQQEEIYENILDKDRCLILNSKLLNTDRTKIEQKLQEYFGKDSNQNNKILITTQVVEAGIDISANYLYSYGCPIDNFIQRCGRCARWGGVGNVEIVLNDDSIYNKEIVNETLEFFKNNQNIDFTWDIQKQCLNSILNPHYKDKINDYKLKQNKNKLADGLSSDLIRDIQNVNIIVDDKITIDSFKKESVNVHINILKKLSKTNTLHILKNKTLKNVNYREELIGETIVIEGYDCIYDELGFRYKEGSKCNSFMYYSSNYQKYEFVDYKKEVWTQHANSVMTIVKKRLLEDKFSDYMINNSHKISMVCGLHDMGKLDIVWQGKEWASVNEGEMPLAHFPFRKNGNPKLFEERKHNHISAYILRPYIDNVLFNVVLQHHGRIMQGKDVKIKKYELHKYSTLCIRSLGFNKEIQYKGDSIIINYKDFITPRDDKWNEFLYLVGTLMECEIESINLYILNNDTLDHIIA